MDKMKRLYLILALSLLSVIVISGYFMLNSNNNEITIPEQQQNQGIVSGTEGEEPIIPIADRGTPNNQSGTPGEPIPLPDKPVVTGNKGCVVGGCSGQLCLEAAEEIASTCEFKNEYACYSWAKCEKQFNGKCGWTKTTAFNQCITASQK